MNFNNKETDHDVEKSKKDNFFNDPVDEIVKI